MIIISSFFIKSCFHNLKFESWNNIKKDVVELRNNDTPTLW